MFYTFSSYLEWWGILCHIITIKMISFFLTTKCNLCCRYCYNAKERNAVVEQTIPLEIAKAGIDWYFEKM